MRVNIEEDIFHSGRLRAFAFHMGCAEETAIGVLCQVWRQTQAQGFVQGSIQDFAQAIRLWLPSYSASQIAAAMIQAGLAEAANDHIYIRGNEPHVSRLQSLRNQAEQMRKSAVKRLSPKKRSKQALSQALSQGLIQEPSQGLSGVLDVAKTGGVQEPSFAPNIQRPKVDRGSRGSEIQANSTESLASLVSEKPSVSPAVFRIRDKFLEGYAELYNGSVYDWDHARDGKQAKALMRDGSEERLAGILAEVDAYFGWKDPEVIRKGHTFSHGYQAFTQVRHRLRADHAAPERHEAAAILTQERWEAGKAAFKQKQEQQWAADLSATSRVAIKSKPEVLVGLPSRKSEGS